VDPLNSPTKPDDAIDLSPGTSLRRDAVWFATGTIAGKAVALVSLPIFARLLTPAEFGRLDVLNAFVSAGLAAFMLGTDVAATRLFFDADVARARQRLLATWLVIIGLVGGLVSVVLLAFADPISTLLLGSSAYGPAISLVAIVLFVGLVHATVLAILRTTGRARAYGLLEGAALLLNAGLAIALLVAWRQDAVAVLLALAVSWTLAAGVGLLLIRPSVSARPSPEMAMRLLALGLPLAPAVAAALVGDFVNRSTLLGVSGPEQAGYLSISIRIASIAALYFSAVQLAWQPHAYRLGSAPPALDRLAIEGRRILTGGALVIGLLIAMTPALIAVIGGGRYEPAGPATSLVLAATLLTGTFMVVTLPLAIARDTRALAASIGAGVIAAIALNLVLVPGLGSAGTASAMIGGQAVALIVGARLARGHARPRPWEPQLVAILGITFAFAVVGATAAGSSPWVRLAFVALIAGLAWREGTLAETIRLARTVPRRYARSGDATR
jgi:O-antigen/teichoic acid export membrane protein